ncbi:MAG: Gfo/Idh/MocA family oxidoreductase [Verrucomicrobiae bacterium]|nr:Gfo/Idh/MocA family oxidoreductase [Verrucomicrobiae bacterium]
MDLARLAIRHGDYHDLLRRKDLDLIVNASYSHQHAETTVEALSAGYHVLCEKPMALNVAEADRMIEAGKKSGKVLAVFQQSRFSPAFREMKRVMESGVLGRVTLIKIMFNAFSRRWDWQTAQKYGGGNLMNTGPHPLDQAISLFGKVKPRVVCFMDRTDNTYGDAEDYVRVILSGEGKPVIEVEISSCCAYPTGMYQVQGTRGGLKGTANELEWKYYVAEEAPGQKLLMDPLSKPDGTPAYCGEELKWHEGKWSWNDQVNAKSGTAYNNAANDLMSVKGPQASVDLFSHMAACYYGMLHATLTEGKPLEVTLEQVRQQMAIFEECRRQNPHVYAKS